MNEKDRARFAKKWELDVNGPPYEGTHCWLWTGAITYQGYGRFYLNGRCYPAHRIAYEHVYGPMPAELVSDHKCNQPRCVSPYHIQAVTQKQNIQYQLTRDFTHISFLTHCKYGHEFTDENTRKNARGYRWCRACARKRQAHGRLKDPQRFKEYARRTYIAHSEKVRESCKRYIADNYEKVRERRRAYYDENRQEILEKVSVYRNNNKEKIKEQNKNYRIRNAEKIKEQKRFAYYKKKAERESQDRSHES